MKSCKAYIASFLLSVFAVVLMPWPLLHDSIADHTTEDDTHCLTHHKGYGTHMEASHAHCAVFDAKTLLYDKVQVIPDFTLILQLTAVYNSCIKASSSQAVQLNLPSRAPPVV